jgi:hypothetical protein
MTKDDSDYEFVDDAFDDPGYTPSGKPAKHTGYQLTNVLPLPRATTYSTQALYGASRASCRSSSLTRRTDQIHDGDIDLEPEYQRGTSCHPVFLFC